MKSFNNKEIQKKLSNLNIDLIVTILGSSVKREANVDSKLANNPEKQKELENLIRALSIIYLYSFLESHKGKFNYKDKNNYVGIDKDQLFLYKYVRDCFAHNYTGELFALEENNTRTFLGILGKKEQNSIKIKNSSIILDPKVVHDFFLFIYNLFKS